MGTISLDHSTWDMVVSTADAKTAGLSAGTQITLSKNTLSSFKNLFSSQGEIISQVSAYQAANSEYSQKMKNAGQKIADEDRQAAQSFSINLEKVRFK